MNRFSEEIPPKTAWTVIAGLVVVFAFVFSAASTSDGSQSGSLVGQAIKATTQAVKGVVVDIPVGIVTSIKDVLVGETEKVDSYNFANVRDTRTFQACVTAELASVRNGTVVAAADHADPRDKKSASARSSDDKVRDAIMADIQALGLQPGAALGCIVKGVAFPGPISNSQKLALESRGYVVHSFGSAAQVAPASAGGQIQSGGVVR